MGDAVIFWSSGKDSAAALGAVANRVRIRALLTTVSGSNGDVAVHGVPAVLLEAQASAIGLPLEKIFIPSPCPNAEYEHRVLETLAGYRSAGVDQVIFGDIFLADIRKYRDALLERAGMTGLYPLWRQDTRSLSSRQIASGIRALVTCIDNNALCSDYAGREYDEAFIESLPGDVDPCGENGEFHTFVYNAPLFEAPVSCRPGAIRDEGQFTYAAIEAAS